METLEWSNLSEFGFEHIRQVNLLDIQVYVDQLCKISTWMLSRASNTMT